MVPEPIAVTLKVTSVLEALGVRYAITGSLASALYGVARATQDVDIVADLQQVSDKQWRNVVGMLSVSGDTLDRAYLEHFA